MKFQTLEEQIIFEKLSGKLPLRDDHALESEQHAAAQAMQVERSRVSAADAAAEQWRGQCFADVDGKIREIDANRICSADRPLGGGLKGLLKRVIRKMVRWYVRPVFEHQTEFNNAVTPAMGRMEEMHKHTAERLSQTTARLNAAEELTLLLEERQGRLVQENRDFRERLEELSGGRLRAAERSIEKLSGALHREEERLEQGLAAVSDRLDIVSGRVDAVSGHFDEQQSRMDALRTQITELEKALSLCVSELAGVSESLRPLREKGLCTTEDDVSLTASQSGEDAIVDYVFRMLGVPPQERTYLDLGANHARELSNTWRFYRQGARGVLVEANPALIGELKFHRSGDVVLNCCVAAQSGGAVDFYVLSGDGLSTPDHAKAMAAIAENPALRVERVVQVERRTVNGILEQYFDKAPAFMNIDLEGNELEILRSVDWERWRPLVISVENIPYRAHLVVGEQERESVEYLKEQDYIEYAFTGINTLMLDKRQLGEVLK